MEFDNLVLLAPGGKPVYIGPTVHAVPYIEEQIQKLNQDLKKRWYQKLKSERGIDVARLSERELAVFDNEIASLLVLDHPPPNTNPADYLMDVIALKGEELHKRWVEYGSSEPLFSLNKKVPENERLVKDYENRQRASILEQIWLILQCRFLIGYSRKIRTFVIHALTCAISGFIVGSISDADKLGSVSSSVYMLNLVVSILAMNASLNDYGSERLVYYREMSSGISRIAYWIAMNLCFMVSCIVLPASFLSFYFAVYQPRAWLWQYSMIIVAFWFAMQSLAHLISIVVEPSKTTVVAGALVVMLNITCGFQPPLKSMEEGWFGLAYTYVNPSRWALEGVWLWETAEWGNVWKEQRRKIADDFGWNLDYKWYDIYALLIYAASCRLLGLFALYYVNRSKQI